MARKLRVEYPGAISHVLKLLVALKLLPPERVQILHSWKHSGFNVHAGDPVPPEHKAELEKLAQYILRNPFSVQKMTMESPTDTIIYRSKLNLKINRNFAVFTPTDFLAAITQHRSSAKCEVRVSKQDQQRGGPWLSEFVIRHSPFVVRHSAHSAPAGQTPVEAVARPHPASLAHRPTDLPEVPVSDARHCRD